LAKKELHETLEKCKKLRIQSYAAETMILMGRILSKEGDNAEALEIFRGAIKIAKKLGDRWQIAMALKAKGETYLALGQKAKALSKLNACLVLAEATHDRILQASAHFSISQILEETRPTLALQHFKAFHDLDRDVFTQRTTKALDEERKKRHLLETNAFKAMYAQISTISALGQEITSSLSLDAILETVHSKILSLMPAETFGLALYREELDELDYAFFIHDGRRLPAIHVPLKTANSLGSWCFRNGKAIFSNNIEADWPKIMATRPTYALATDDNASERKSVIFVPIIIHNQKLGLLSVQSNVLEAYTLYHLDSLKALASYVGIALENARLFQDVQHRATYDHLTKILNRSSILEKGEEQFLRIRRYGGSLSVLMIDVDHFKFINDRYGHQIGDEVLFEIAQHISHHLRDVDFAGRYGGEEFFIVLPETNAEGAMVLAERIRAGMLHKVLARHNITDVGCTLSIGAHELEASDHTLDDAIRKADEALYWCKNQGRNVVHQG
jgi:diguanylate cyclase (GGDEF)-like protein